MAKYHNSPNGPRACKAEKGLCPYAAAGGEHFDTQAEAQVAYEATMAEAFGGLEVVKKTVTERKRQEAYQQKDKLLAKVQVAKASPAAQKSVATLRAVQAGTRRLDSAAVKTGLAARNAKALTAEARAQYQAMRPAPGTAMTPPLKPGLASRVLPGDRLEDGSVVTSVVVEGEAVIVKARRTNGTFRPKATYGTADKIAYQRITKRQARGSVLAGRAQKRILESPLYARAQAASELQRQAFHTLRGADMEKVAVKRAERQAARAKWRSRALGYLSAFSQRASSTQQKAVLGLSAVHAARQAHYTQAA